MIGDSGCVYVSIVLFGHYIETSVRTDKYFVYTKYLSGDLQI